MQRRATALAALIGFLLVAHAGAADRYWIDSAGGTFTDTGNWSTAAGGAGGASVPGAGDVAQFRIGGGGGQTYTVDFPKRQFVDPPLTYAMERVFVGASDKVTFQDLSSGIILKLPAKVTANELELSSGGLTNVVTTLADFQVGFVKLAGFINGTSTLDVNGGKLTVNGSTFGDDIALATAISTSATLNVNNGADVVVNDPTTPIVRAGVYGLSTGNRIHATINVTGGGSTLTLNDQGQLIIGSGRSDAALNITAGGSVTDGYGLLAASVNSTATAVVDGNGSIWSSSVALEVGSFGSGALTVRNGGSLVTHDTYVGRNAGSTGSVTIDGVGVAGTWTNTGIMGIGIVTDGAINVLHGGKLNGAGATLAVSTGSTGAATIDGIGSEWTSSGDVTVGLDGAATLNILSGAHINGTSAHVASGGSSSGVVTIDAAGSKWSLGNLYLDGSGTSTVALSNGGEVEVTGSVQIGLHGTVKGRGLVDGNIINGGVVAPGASPGILQVDGDYTQSAAGKLKIELGGTTVDSQYDQLHVTGAVALDGTLQVSFLNAFIPAAGSTFDVLDGTITGTFSTLTLPSLAPGLVWRTSQLYSTGVLRVASTLFSADFNEDGVVDSADLALWTAGVGTPNGATHYQGDADADFDVDGADFLFWQRQLGSSSLLAANLPSANTVPEPTAAWLMLVGALAIVRSGSLPLGTNSHNLSDNSYN